MLTTTVTRGERRSLALNVRSSLPTPIQLEVYVDLPGLPSESVRLYKVNWTGNDLSNWAAAELEFLGQAGESQAMFVLPGVTQQIWIEVSPQVSVGPGAFAGAVRLSSLEHWLEMPLHVTVLGVSRIPDSPLKLGGWDYADDSTDPRYAVTPENVEQLVAYLRSRGVNVAWGHRVRVMPWNHISRTGNLLYSPDPRALHVWMRRWRTAERFRILVAPYDGIAGIKEDDPLFPIAVGNWARSWATAIRKMNRSPEEFDLSILDEPQTSEATRIIEAWAHAIRDSGAGFRIWTNPAWPDASDIPASLTDSADAVAINLRLAEQDGGAYWEWVQSLANKGKPIEVYACEGPSRRMDPYAYYRLSPWRAFFANAKAISFWSFSYTGESRSDNEFAAGENAMEPFNYSPLFINDAQIRPGKHMEALAEGMEDVHYLAALRDVSNNHPDIQTRLRAEELLSSAEAFVRSREPLSAAEWDFQSESSEADLQRIVIGHFLDSISN